MNNFPGTQRTALVIGALGAMGQAVARSLLNRGWRVTALARRTPPGDTAAASLTWIVGDAMNPAQVCAAAKGAQLIVHAVNPAGYRHWGRLAPPMLDNTIAAAGASGARVLLPGNIYNYGPDDGPILSETTPQRPISRKGLIRVELESRLRSSGVPALIVRAGDFFGPGAGSSSWFSQLIKPGRPVTRVINPGDRGVGHAWAYLPDLAETMAAVADRQDELERFAEFHFEGHWLARGEAMVEAIQRVAEAPPGPPRAFPWLMVSALSPAAPLFRELLEMRYLWRRPLRLDNAKLLAFLGREPRTSLDAAVAQTLESLGCLKTRLGVRGLSNPAC